MRPLGSVDFAENGEVGGKGLAERCILSEVGVESIAAANQLPEQWGLAGGTHSRDEVFGSEGVAEGGDVAERNLALKQQMMQDSEHHDGVEVA